MTAGADDRLRQMLAANRDAIPTFDGVGPDAVD
jgi:hypothetical protein